MRWNNDNFSKPQLEQIQLGIEQGLTKTDVAIYAVPNYTVMHMESICAVLLSGKEFDKNKLGDWADSLSAAQFNQVCQAICHDVNSVYIEQFAKPEVHFMQMEQFRLGLGQGLKKEEAQIFLAQTDLMPIQLQTLRKIFGKNIPIHVIEMCIHDEEKNIRSSYEMQLFINEAMKHQIQCEIEQEVLKDVKTYGIN